MQHNNEIEEKAHKLLHEQYLITAYIEQRLTVANFIYNRYNSDKPVLRNSSFFHFVAQNISRSLIIDLHALFGVYNNTNIYSLFLHGKSYYSVFSIESIKKVKEGFKAKSKERALITDLRNKEIAHYDFTKKKSINITMTHLPMISDIFELAKNILIKYSCSFKNEKLRGHLSFEQPNSVLFDLEEIIKDLEPVCDKWLNQWEHLL